MNSSQPGDPYQLRGYGGETVDGHISHQYSISDVNSTYGSRPHPHGPNGSAHLHDGLQSSPSVTPSPGGTLGRGKPQHSQIHPDHLEYGRSPNRYASNYEHVGMDPSYRTQSPVSEAGSRRYQEYRGPQGYVDYDGYGPGSRNDYVYQPGLGPAGIYGTYGDPRTYALDPVTAYGPVDPKVNPSMAPSPALLADRPPTPPSPSERSESPPPHRLTAQNYMMQGLPYPPSGYSELDSAHAPPGRDPSIGGGSQAPERYMTEPPHSLYGDNLHPASQYRSPSVLNGIRDYEDQAGGYHPDEVVDERLHRGLTEQMSNLSFSQVPQDPNGVRWRNPDLPEVIAFLSNPDKDVRANAAAYLQHLSFNSDSIKQKTRLLGGLPPLVALLDDDAVEVYRNACGALRNLSYGRQNDENKRSVHRAGGVTALVRLLRRSKTEEVHELTTSVLWNLSSCEELKRPIIDESLNTVIGLVLIPHSGYDRSNPKAPHWSTVLRNTTGILRNVSSAGEYARKILREANGLIEALLYLVRVSVQVNDIENKSVENTVCVLRNLSYRCQEVEDPNYDKHPLPTQSRATAQPPSENFGCFGATKKKKDTNLTSPGSTNTGMTSVEGSRDKMPGGLERTEPPKGMELLWQPDVVQPYLALLSNCSNPETLEAAAGALQNLAACYWQPAIELRAAVRKEKGLPVLVELLRMEVDRVVCAVATALRNLALDQRNKELIGKYAMRDLVQKLPTGNAAQDQATSDDTISAVLATLNEVIKKNAEFSRAMLDAEGVPRLINLARPRQGLNRSPRVAKFASQVLVAMWTHQELRDVYKKNGFKESDFVARGSAVPSSPPPSGINSSTLNRPMASQGGTRYEDKTLSLQRGNQRNSESQYRDNVPMADMQYAEGASHGGPPGGVRILPPGMSPGEPVYAQVNREKKRSRHFDGSLSHDESNGGGGNHWSNYEDTGRLEQPLPVRVMQEGQPGGDSWV